MRECVCHGNVSERCIKTIADKHDSQNDVIQNLIFTILYILSSSQCTLRQAVQFHFGISLYHVIRSVFVCGACPMLMKIAS